MAILTLEDVKDYLELTQTDDDDFLIALIDEAQDQLEGFLNRKIEQASYTEDFSGDGTGIRILKHRPIVTVTQVLISIDNSTEITSDNYESFDEAGIIELKSNIFPTGIKNCRVKYDAGYASGSEPASIKLALKELCALIYEISPRGEGRLGKSSINMPDGGTVNYTDKLPSGTLKLLSRYRDVRF